MGSWGPGIFSDDTAADVRDDFKELIGDGVPADEATARMLTSYAEVIDDPDDAPVFWLALAATQFSMGRLQDDVRDRALEVIDSGVDLRRWEEDASTSDVSKRRAALTKLRDQLVGPQKSPTNVRPEYREVTDWKVNEHWAYRLGSGRWIVFRVVALDSRVSKGVLPVVEVLDKAWPEQPSLADAAAATAKTHSGYGYSLDDAHRPADAMILTRLSKTDYPQERLVLLGTVEPKRTLRRLIGKRAAGAGRVERIPPLEFWKRLDESLAKHWGYT